MRVGPSFGDGDTNAEPLASLVDFELKLWEDGRIDVLYGDNPAGPGDGRNASIGIENEAGTDALQFSLFDDLVSSNTAYRYEIVPSGVVSGTVTDGNDGLPIAGAVVTAHPGGRTATTDDDGLYSLRLRPGTYTLAFSAHNYVTHEEDHRRRQQHADGRRRSRCPDRRRAAHRVVGDAGLRRDDDVDGDGLEYGFVGPHGSSVSERKPDSAGPPAGAARLLEPRLGPDARAGRREDRSSSRAAAEALVTVVDDPDDDSTGSTEIAQIRGGSDNAEMSLAIDFSAETPMDEPVGYVLFDTDQDRARGSRPRLFGLPEQDIGVDFFADLFAIHDSDPVVFIVSADFELVAEVPAVLEGQSVSFSVPLEAFDNDDGTIDVASVIGTFGPEDWAPDAGHGTIQSFTDAPWIEPHRARAYSPPGETTDVDVTLGARGPSAW